MKRLLLILILTLSFQSLTKADDIREFEIEGISIGDSLLDFFNEDEILKNDGNYYSKKKFVTTVFNKHRKIKNYDWLQISYKRNDSKYIIYSIDGVIEFKKNYKACLKKKDIVVNELSTLFDKNNTRIDKGKHRADKSGKSTYENLIFELDGGHQVVVSCLDWSKAFEKKYFDHMKVWVNHTEFKEFIISNPF
ncbi:hypothetical protein OAO99_01190 [Candidatus Pelagibacter sp.]|nr:hypothetical protein [Candidatus Pelagibacter sp.]